MLASLFDILLITQLSQTSNGVTVMGVGELSLAKLCAICTHANLGACMEVRGGRGCPALILPALFPCNSVQLYVELGWQPENPEILLSPFATVPLFPLEILCECRN